MTILWHYYRNINITTILSNHVLRNDGCGVFTYSICTYTQYKHTCTHICKPFPTIEDLGIEDAAPKDACILLDNFYTILTHTGTLSLVTTFQSVSAQITNTKANNSPYQSRRDFQHELLCSGLLNAFLIHTKITATII